MDAQNPNNQSPDRLQERQSLTLRQWLLLIVVMIFVPLITLIILLRWYSKRNPPAASLTPPASTAQNLTLPLSHQHRQFFLFLFFLELIMIFLSYFLPNFVSGNLVIATFVGLNAAGAIVLSRSENVEKVVNALVLIRSYLVIRKNIVYTKLLPWIIHGGGISFPEKLFISFLTLNAILSVFNALLFPVQPISMCKYHQVKEVTTESTSQLIGLSDCPAFDVTRHDGILKKQATDLLKDGKVKDANSLLQKVLSGDINDSEILIDMENQRVLNSGPLYLTVVVVTILTGLQAHIGRDNLQAAYIFQKEYNTSRLHKLPLRLLVANIGDKAQFATQVANQIVGAAQTDPSIVGVVGWPFGSPQVLVAIQTLAAAHIPMISPTASEDNLSGKPYFFRISPSNSQQADLAIHYAQQVLHAKNIALFVDKDNENSANLTDDFQQACRTHHIHGFTETYISRHPKTIWADLDGALQLHPDLIFFSGYSGDVSILLAHLPTTGSFASLLVLGGNALSQLGGYPPNTSGFDRLRFVAASFPDEWEFYHQQTKQELQFFADYQRTFDPDQEHSKDPYGFSRPDSDVIMSFDAMTVLLNAATVADEEDNITAASIESGLLNTTGSQNSIQGISGRIAFNNNHDPIDKTVVMLAVDQNRNIHLLSTKGCFLKQKCQYDDY